ncbi:MULTISPECIES: ATP-binding protein [Cysteiniphilum]|uniref:ATPase AAA n=1 Tax=Cysteiniphilum litorale TaxID=2056700 RepID=A0A8J3E9Q0_9GAMM|nr:MULTISPECIES: ATP-binding protein [Cysteiniphilum]GGG03294.1 ATPase AAA [Cysteiniphilum litorale]
MKTLPIGISGFEKIIADECLYVDKTKHIYNLLQQGGGYYFLSRPRRFGKSLLIDTLKQAFLGNKQLFTGLFLEHHWNWDVKHPVIHFNFGSSSSFNSMERFFADVHETLDIFAKTYEITLIQTDYGAKFGELIRRLHEKTRLRVVILIDEYDKPILDHIDDKAQARLMRDILGGLYAYIKKHDSDVHFALLTGVSRFSKVSLFSDLNNLNDITLDPNYADICGYTQTELEHYFNPYFEQKDIDYPLLKKWYNGYNFAGNESQKVYNPFDILLFINKGFRYQNYWFETATPSFLIKAIEKNHYFIPDLEDIVVSETMLSKFDIDSMPVETLLFQTGYLTIKEITMRGNRMAYRLSYPNYEVKCSLNESLAVIASNESAKNQVIDHLVNAFEQNDFKRLAVILSSHFASIPHDWYRNNNIHHYEGFYASIVYSFIVALGYDVIPEDTTNHGRIDLSLIMHDKIIIIEFKLNKYGSAENALKQIKAKDYAKKYVQDPRKIYLLGISFDADNKNIADIAFEQYRSSS